MKNFRDNYHHFRGRILFLSLLLFLFICSSQQVVAAIKSINFNGSTNRIDYDLATGKFSVYFNGNKVITDAYASCNSNSTYASYSSSYTSRTYSSSAITDGFGTGTKHVITLSGSGMFTMQQNFYVYTGLPYFFTEVVLSGTNPSCYYMTPLTSSNVNIYASGDNRALFMPFDNDAWIRFNAIPLRTANFISSEGTAIYDNTSRAGLITGSVEHNVWKTGVSIVGSGTATLSNLSVWGGYTSSYTRDGRGHGWVDVGKTSCKSPKIMVGYFTDWRSGLDEYGKAQRWAEPRYIFNWTGGTPFGWNSWGAIQTSINLTKAKSVVDFFANSLPVFRNDNTLYIDLDSYWDNMTDAELKNFADYCKSKGFKAGIYWAPFVDWATWDRQVEGSTYNYYQIRTKVNGNFYSLDGGYAIDPTHPGTKDRIRYFVNRFKAAGFEMIKLDFLTHASLEADSYYNTSLHTGMEAFRNGMEYLTDQLAGSMLVYASICPNLATSRYSHMRRLACDTYGSISDTKYELNSLNYGWWQKQAYNFLDADYVVFGNFSQGENRARLASVAITGSLMTGDDFSTTAPWTTTAQNLLQKTDILDISRIGGWGFFPVEGNTGDQPNELFMRGFNNYIYLAVFNYGSSSKNYTISLSRLGWLSTTGTYTVKELFSGSTSSVKGTLSCTVGATDCKIYRFDLSTLKSAPFDSESTNEIINFQCYPNPVTDKLKIWDTETIASVQVSTITGQVIKELANVYDNQTELDLTNLSNGMYIISVLTLENTTKMYKVIKE